MSDLMFGATLFHDRLDAGSELALELARERGDVVVVGLARGGVVCAAAVARLLGAPLDVVCVRKVGHPFQPEYALGAVTPDDGDVYLRAHDDLSDDEIAEIVDRAREDAAALDRTLHALQPPLSLEGRTAVLVDDGLATGATMIAAARWARSRGAARIVAAVPVAAQASLDLVRPEVDAVVCPHAMRSFFAVATWYESFDPVGDAAVISLLDVSRRRLVATASP